MRIRFRLVVGVSAAVVATFVALAAAVTELHRQERVEDLRRRHAGVMQAVGLAAGSFIEREDLPGLQEMVSQIAGTGTDPDFGGISVVAVDGRVLADTDPARRGVTVKDAFVDRALGAGEPVVAHEGEVLRLGVPAIGSSRGGAVVATYSTARISGAVTRVQWALFAFAGLVGLVLYSALFATIHRMVIQPVKTLQKVARRMGEGELEARVPELGEGELGELGHAFNKMATTLRAHQENLEQLVADRTRELREANRRLETLAVTDGLTGVFNHRRFQESVAHESQRSSRSGRPFSVMMLDVDHFKRFNDSMGHPAGDDALRRIAALLKGVLRSSDVLARYGGEEFAIVLPDTGKDEAARVAERLRALIEREMNEAQLLPRVTVSIGVAAHGADGETPQEILVAADAALYVAKRTGRNRVVAESRRALEKSA